MTRLMYAVSAVFLVALPATAQSSELDLLKDQLVECLSGKTTREEVVQCRGFYSDECGMKASDLPMIQEITEQTRCVSTEEKAWLSAAELIAQTKKSRYRKPDFKRCDAIGADPEAGAAASIDEADCRLEDAIEAAVTTIFE